MTPYEKVISASGIIERMGNMSFETIRFASIPSGQSAIQRRGATSWPLVVLGASAICLDATGADASPLVLVQLRDAGSEQPFTHDFISVYSLFGPLGRPNPARFIKPFLLTRNRRLEIEVRNTAASTVSLTVTLWGIRHYGNPLAPESRD